jgi:acetolactate synthase I/II/III large subunit
MQQAPETASCKTGSSRVSTSSGRTGSEVIVEYLVREGVPYVVGLCGHGNLGMLDALYDRRDDITTLSTQHESLAGFIADAYYRVARRPLATLTSCGPGSANLPVALGSALMDDSAFLAITGNVPTSHFNRAPFQETGRFYQADFPSVVRPYVKRSFQATRADQLPVMLRRAFATMLSGRPGPVHLDVPLDIFGEVTAEPVPDPRRWQPRPPASAAPLDDVRAIADRLEAASHPVIVVGAGCKRGSAALELGRAVGAPVASSPLGKDVVDNSDSYYLGATGRNGTYQANRATRNADLVVAFGTRFDDRSTSAWIDGYTYDFNKTELIHVHVDADELGRNYPPAIAVCADPSTVISQLVAEAGQRAAARADADNGWPAARWDWIESIQGWRSQWLAHIAPSSAERGGGIPPDRLVSDLRTAIPQDAIVLSDVGAHHNWLVQRWETQPPGMLLQSWGFASMGFGVAGCLGARLAAPDRPVVSVVGDGGFLMNPSAVATAVQYGLRSVWVVWNNGGFISIRDQQRGYFGADRELATSFVNSDGSSYTADYAAMARSMGGNGIRVDSADDVVAAVKEALASDRPTVIDMSVDPDVAQPSVGTWDLPPQPQPTPSFGWPDDG